MKAFRSGSDNSSVILAGVEALPAWKRLQEVSTISPMVTPNNQQDACDPRVALNPQVCKSGEKSMMQLGYQDTLEGLSSVGLLLQGPPRGHKRKAISDGLCSIEERKWYLRKRLLQAYPQLRENVQMLCSNARDFNQQLTKDIVDEVYAKNKRHKHCSRKPSSAGKLSIPIGNGGEIEVSSCLHSTAPSLSNQDLPLAQMMTGLGFSTDWIKDVADMVVEDLNQFGICVVDDFLGSQHAGSVFDDVNSLYNKGGFRNGKVVSPSHQTQDSKTIRGDVITWLSGSENACSNTQQLLGVLDAIISAASKHSNPGKVGDYNITTRTRAMVACYPGSGAHYVKHVDNPNGDGRCITTIYYLNKNWQKGDGGILRLYPEDSLHKVAEIEPLFDRMVFFWSDRRNPHEVLPAKMPRFAITVWYLNQDEREAYISRRITKD